LRNTLRYPPDALTLVVCGTPSKSRFLLQQAEKEREYPS
jgi:hypothetical protein